MGDAVAGVATPETERERAARDGLEAWIRVIVREEITKQSLDLDCNGGIDRNSLDRHIRSKLGQ